MCVAHLRAFIEIKLIIVCSSQIALHAMASTIRYVICSIEHSRETFQEL